MHINSIIKEVTVCIDQKEDGPELGDAVSKWSDINSEQITKELIDRIAAQEDTDSDIRHSFPDSHISYAIDPENAGEVDDAIAYCEKDKAFLIHISDVTRYISPEGEFKRFFFRALQNKCSMYLASLTYGMFPGELNTQLLSHGAPLSDGSVITIRLRSKAVHGEKRIRGVTMHPKSPFLIDIFLGRIPPPRRLTYEQAAAILQNGTSEQDRGLCKLYDAFCTQFPKPVCNANGEDVRSESPVQSLVTGMMCQAHEAAGMFNKSRCAGLVQLRENVPGFRGRVRHITSPMRRAEDLLNHRQVKEDLRGNYCGDAEIFMDEHRDEIRKYREVLRDGNAELQGFWDSFASASR